MSGIQTPGRGRGMILLCERLFAKEDKSRWALQWKSPRLSYYRADKGLQYGLSGDRVALVATLGHGL